MLAMNNPAIARMLDEQERQKQYQQRVAPTNYGNDAMGRFLTAASGAQKSLGAGAQAVAGNLMGQEKPMGMNEKMAVQADQMRKAEEAKKVAQGQRDVSSTGAFINSLVKNKQLTKEQGAGFIQQIAGDPSSGNEVRDVALKLAKENREGGLTNPKGRKVHSTKNIDGKLYAIFDDGEKELLGTEGLTRIPLTALTNIKDVSDVFTAESIKKATVAQRGGKKEGETDAQFTLRIGDMLNKKDVLTADNSKAYREYKLRGLESRDIEGTLNKFNTVTQQSNLLGDGIITGVGANALVVISKIGSQLGILDEEQSNRLAKTETYNSNAGNLVAQVIKAFGAGTGLSDADREYAKDIAAGRITLDEVSLAKITDIIKRNAIREIEAYNEDLDKLGGEFLRDKKQVPVFQRSDVGGLTKLDVDGVIYYRDDNKNGYTGEVYDSNGFQLPVRGAQ